MLFFLIQVTIGFISLTLYALVCIIVIQQRKFLSHAFIRLYIVFAIVVSYNSPLYDVLLYFPSSFLLTFVYFLGHYLAYCQMICIIFLVLLTFRAIAFPFYKYPVWETSSLFFLSLVFLPPIPFTYKILYLEAQIKYRPYEDGFMIFLTNRKGYDFIYALNIFEISATFICLLLHIIAVKVLCNQKIKAPTHSKREVRLFVLSLLEFFVMFAKSSLVLALIVMKNNPNMVGVLMLALPFFTDLVTLAPPYIFLALNPRIRHALFNLLRLRKNVPEPVSV
ncbi:hypothetical protein WR25_09491 [Diploscapter pachys]|uniref:Serpentine receptor class gamma n=1 Tax=Diploscapter pachys TaxID=2018661 RepID=A0A2A2K2V0_9BILA|nr:hypothetical protein WR25_09491 [Diploscapter pachys]